MGDFKSKLPDLKDITSIASKLFRDIKTSIEEIITDYKQKHGSEDKKPETEVVSSAPEPSKPTGTVTDVKPPVEPIKPSEPVTEIKPVDTTADINNSTDPVRPKEPVIEVKSEDATAVKPKRTRKTSNKDDLNT